MDGPKLYRAGDLEVDLACRAVRRANQPVHLRARTFDLLVYLIERADRVVPQQELLTASWPDTAVSGNSVMQCVNEARRALEDDPRDPRYIRTVAKTGYQFIGSLDLEKLAQVTTVEPIQTVEQVTTVELAYDGPRTASRRWLLAAAVVATLGAAWLYNRPPQDGAIAILPFENQVNSAQLNWLREGLPDMLVTNLSRSPGLRVLARQYIPAAQPLTLDAARELGRRTGASTVMLGSFAELGGQIRVTAQVYDVDDGKLRAAGSFVADEPAQILTRVDLLALRLANDLGHPVQAPDRLAGLSSLMTGNIEAYRHYAEGMERANALRPVEALERFRKAIELDPSFAMAHARIGFTYVSVRGEPENGKPYLQTAFRLSQRLTPRDRLHIVAWYAIANREYETAIRSYRELIAHDPGDVEAHIRLGSLQSGEGRMDEAIETVRRALVLDPESASGWNVLSGICSRADRVKEAVEAAHRYTALVPHEPNSWDTLGMAQQVAGQPAEAERSYRQALHLRPDFNIALIHLGGLLYQQGRYREAATHCEHYITLGVSAVEKSRGHACLAGIYWRQGRLAEARTSAERESALRPGLSMTIALLDLESGKSDQAMAYLRNVPDVNERGRRIRNRVRRHLEGRVAQMQGRRQEAIAIFRQALSEPPAFYQPDWWEDCLADAFLHFGMLDEAITEYQRALAKYPAIALPRYRLALAYEKQGRRVEARQQYQRFLGEWESADADAPEAAAARLRLSAFAKR